MVRFGPLNVFGRKKFKNSFKNKMGAIQPCQHYFNKMNKECVTATIGTQRMCIQESFHIILDVLKDVVSGSVREINKIVTD